MKKKLLLIGLVLVLTFSLCACGGDSSTDNGGGTTAGNNDQETKIPYFKDGVLETDNCKIEITGADVVKPDKSWGETNPSLVISYNYTNKREDEKFTPSVDFIFAFECDQESADASLEISLNTYPDKYSEAVDMSSASVKPGKTVECVEHYELVDSESPVTLTANDGAFGDKLGTYEIKLK